MFKKPDQSRSRRRKAIDAAGNLVEIVERREPETANDESIRPVAQSKFFDPDGRELLPEGHGFFKNPFGVRYRVID